MNYCFILGPPKSGTTLLLSLLEGHPQLSVLSYEIQYYRYLYNSIFLLQDYKTKLKSTGNKLNGINNNILKRIYNSEFEFKLQSKEYTPQVLMLKHLMSAISVSDVSNLTNASDFYGYHFGLSEKFLNKKFPVKYRIEKTPFNEFYFYRIINDFKKSKFIYVLRNPFANITALHLRRKKYKGKLLLGFFYYLFAIKSSYKRILKIYDIYPGNIFILPFDLLVMEPIKYMNKIANFLDIQFEDTFLLPTLFGETWSGNSMYTSSFTKIDTTPLYNWKSFIDNKMYSAIEKFLMEDYNRTIKYFLSSKEVDTLLKLQLRY